MAKLFDKDGGSGGSTLRDIYLRHGINLTRYSSYEARRLLDILDTANAQIKALITKSKAIETKKKYRRVAAEIKRISGELNQQLIGQVELDFTELAQTETEFVEKAMRTIGVTVDFELPAPAKVYAAASFGTYTGFGKETYESYMNKFSQDLFKTWDTVCRAGYMTGMTAAQINKTVLGSQKDLTPDQMKGLRNSLEANTKTMIASLCETARNETYRQNSRLFSGYRYLGTLDSRTCLACGSLDGKVFKGSEPPTEPILPQHLRCRCLWLPVIKGMEEPLEGDERASADGPVDAKTTYADWLKTQPESVQRDILGPTRFGLFKSGMPVSSFVSGNGTLTLRKLVEKEGLELFGAGLKDKSWQAQDAYSDTYYAAIRNRASPTDIDSISKNTGFSRNDIQSIRNHVFVDEHDLGDSITGRFKSDWQIAQAWQRMEQGWRGNGMTKYHECDILLLKHELEELSQMAKYGYNTVKAHDIAEGKYPWDITIGELDK